ATYSGQHGVGTTATGTLTLPLPVPATSTPGASAEGRAGHDDFIGTVFSGCIPVAEKALSLRGTILTAQLVGASSRLRQPRRDAHPARWQHPARGGQGDAPGRLAAPFATPAEGERLRLLHPRHSQRRGGPAPRVWAS